MWGWLQRLFGRPAPHEREPPSDGAPSTRVFVAAVVGESFRNNDGTSRQEIIRSCRIGDALRLIPEPTNPADPNAVAVHAPGGQIGYLRREVAARLNKQIRDRATASAVIMDIRGGEDVPFLGVFVEVTMTDPSVRKAAPPPL